MDRLLLMQELMNPISNASVDLLVRHLLDHPDLLRAVEKALAQRNAARRAEQIVLSVGDDGHWFEVAGSERVDLRRKHALRRVFAHLVEARLTRPGQSVSSRELIERGWPGEQILKRAAANRLRVAIHTLRSLGLADAIATDADGYSIAVTVDLELASVASAA